jgi:glycosyltransferase involved in cell wall biosynthesis
MNYWLLAARRFGKGTSKLAYFGHGRNRQSSPGRPAERLKRALVGAVDWWFAYTAGTAEYLAVQGFPRDRITTVENSIDIETLQRQLAQVTPEQIARTRAQLGITSEDAPVALFCGSLYEDKKLDFLVHAAEKIRSRLPDFHLVIVGSGPDRAALEARIAGRGWIRFVGAKFDAEKAVYFRLANVFLNPGLVGLSILDAFAAGLPFFTTDLELHSPEVEYLDSGRNGVMTPFDADKFAESVTFGFVNRAALAHLSQGALETAARLGTANMARRFADGIARALA